MKILLKSLCLLLIIPIVSIFSLTACKNKKDNSNKPREYISYAEADKILKSAYVALYGEELTPPNATQDTTPTFPETNSSATDIKLIKQDTELEKIQITDDKFNSSINGEIKVNDNYYMYISSLVFIPLKITRTLLRDGLTNIIGNAIEFSFDNKYKLDPDNLKCKVRVNVYNNVFAIEMQREADEMIIDTCILNIVFDDTFNATHILYTISKFDSDMDIFAFASHNLTEQTTKVLKIDETTTGIQTSIKTMLENYKQEESTPNTTYDFASLYVSLI